MAKTFIIAEIGVNHNGDLAIAKKLIDGAQSAGADAVKFQAFNADALVTKDAASAHYQSKNTGIEQSQHAMLKQLSLTPEQLVELAQYCFDNNIAFMASAFDEASLTRLIEGTPTLRKLKIGSGEITNWPFLWLHGRSGIDVILSTGMANLAEVEQALAVLATAYCEPEVEAPSMDYCYQVLHSEQGQSAVREKVTLLHCTSAYPAPLHSINLNAMTSLRAAFPCEVGYSDHSLGDTVSIAAVSLGATVIEKHITLDTKMSGPDHRASMTVAAFANLVKGIRDVEVALGAKQKLLQPCEVDARDAARKSLVAACDIAVGDIFNNENVTCMRPGTGICASRYWFMLGRKSNKTYKKGELLDGSFS